MVKKNAVNLVLYFMPLLSFLPSSRRKNRVDILSKKILFLYYI